MKARNLVEQVTESLLGNVPPPDTSRIDSDELTYGTTQELEHTNDLNQAEQIAFDHLLKDPDYYRKMREAGID